MKKFLIAAWNVFSVLLPAMLGLMLLLAWISSEIHSGNSLIIPHLVVLLVSLFLIFFADALEVAYSLLRYKHQEQFSGAEASVLAEMHDNENLVYEAREWLVTVLIVALTLIVEFDDIYIFNWKISDLYVPHLFVVKAKTLFSVLFTTVPVLWFAQGLSKRIARDCPQKMLGTGALVWALIKAIGKITYFFGLDKPTEALSELLKNSDNFSSELNLRPSDYNYYISSLLRYGYSIHDLSAEITIDKSGACKVKQRVLYYVVSAPGDVFVRKLELASGPDEERPFIVNVQEVYSGPLIREAEASGESTEILRELDEISGAAIKRQGNATLFSRKPCNIGVFLDRTDDKRPNLRRFKIDTRGSIASSGEALAILVEFTSYWQEKSFNVLPMERDFFYMKFDCPCFQYRLSIEFDEECTAQFSGIEAEAFCSNETHWGERERLRRSLVFDPAHPVGLLCKLTHPFPGTEYKFRWTLDQVASQSEG